MAGPFGGAGRVAERHRQRRRSGGSFHQPPQLEEPEVGVGRLRQPLEDDRQELLHDPGPAGEAGGQLPHRGAGALDVGEAEGGETFLGGLGREGTGPGERLEQRREEEALVDAPHRPLVLAVFGLEPLARGAFGAVAVAEDAGQPHQGLLVGRDEVGLLLVVELEAVLDGAQELVGAVEAIDVRAVDVATVGELVERVEGRGRTHGPRRRGRARAAAAAPRTRCRGCRPARA